MDKNTLWGLLLMGLVVFGFMWLNQPSKEDIERQRQEQAQQQIEQAQRDQAAANEALRVDSLTAQETELVRNAVKQHGKADTVAGSFRLANGPVDLALAADGTLSGTVKSGASTVTVDQILSRSYGSLDAVTARNAVNALRDCVKNLDKYREFGDYISGDSTTVTIANDVLRVNISNKGAQIAAATLLDPKYVSYGTYRDSLPVEALSPALGGYSFSFSSANQRYNTSEFYFKPVEVSDSSVLMRLDLGEGVNWGIRYTLPRGENYTVRMEIEQQGMESIIPPSQATIDFAWNQRMPQNEAGRVFEDRNSALYYKYLGGDVDHLSESSDDDSEDITEQLRWVGYKNQFFSAVLIADKAFASAKLSSVNLENNREFIKQLDTRATLEYSAADARPASFTFYLGPNSYPLLSDLQDAIVPDTDLELTRLVPLGWALFRWINTLIIIPVFSFLGGFISDYGIIILLLTIFIKIILFPFTYKSYMSQAKMRVLAPEIKAINDKYPGTENAMKRQQETMALYSRAGASPFSGCLPMLLQMPILIAMFNFFPSAIELRGEEFLWAHNLAAPDAIISWDFNIPFISSTFGNHISLFCLLMTVVNILYTRINMQAQPGGNSMPGMKWMMYLMPVMFLVFFNNYAAGLSYYYFLSLLITIGQTYAFRLFVNEDKVRAQMLENAKKPKKKSGFMARLEEAQRKQQAMLREQEKKNKRR